MRRVVSLVVLTVLLAGLGQAIPRATAGNDVGSFEIDGNTPDDPAGEPTDWDAKADDQDPDLTITPFDDATGSSDDSFGGGSKQEKPGTWECTTNSAPNKGDITGGAIAFREINDKQYTYVNFTRTSTEGSVDIDYEFNQSAAPNPSCPDLPVRTAGDLLIAFDATKGGKVIDVRLFEWAGDESVGTFVALPIGAKGTTWDGATNGDGTNKSGNFGEAVLNLTDTVGGVECGKFNSVFMKSRSSSEINSALQDRTEKKPVTTGICPVSSMAKGVRNVTAGDQNFTPATDAKPGDTVEYQLSYTNAGPGTAHDVEVRDVIAAGQTFVNDSCLPNTIACTLTNSTLTWDLGTVEPGSVVLKFQVQITGSFDPGTATEIDNVATATNDENESPTSPETTVTVKTPSSSLVKSVRNASTGGAFATTATATPGDLIEYQLVYTNAGPGTATNVVVSDPIPTKTTWQSCSPTCTTTGSPVSSVSWTTPGPVGANSPLTFTFTVEMDGPFTQASTDITNVGSVDTDEEAEEDSNPTTVTVLANPTSSLVKSVRNATTNPSGTFTPSTAADPGDVIEYKLTYLNSGPGQATGVVVSDPIPANSTFLSCNPACTQTGSPTVTSISWSLGTVAANVPKEVTFKVTLAATFPVGETEVTNIGETDTNEETPKTSNEVTVTVAASPASAVVKSVRNVTAGETGFAPSTNGDPGDTIEYQIVYTNGGNAVATGVVVSDPIPANTTFVSCTPLCTQTGSPVTSIRWDLGAMAPGVPATLTFTVTLAAVFPAGTTSVENVAKTDTDQEPERSSNKVTVTVVANPASRLAKAVRNATTNGSGNFTTTATAEPGHVVEYRLVYTNVGNANATGVVVSDPIPAHSTWLSCSPSCATTGSPTVTSVSWDLGTVAPDVPTTLTFKVTLDSVFPAGETQVKNMGSLDTDQEPLNTSNEVTVTVTAATELTLAKQADKAAAVANDTITYTLTYGNTGNAVATGSVITETIPTGTSFSSCSADCDVSGTTVTWDVGDVAPDGGGSVTLTVTVDATIDACTICNVATIASPDQNDGVAVDSNQVCVPATPAADPSTAKASGSAKGLKAYVPLLNLPLLNVDISNAASSRTGVGSAGDDDSFAEPNVGVFGIATVTGAKLLTTTSSSQVSATLGARQTSTSEVLGLNLLNGLVTADVLRSVAATTARGDGSSYSAAGTTAANLKVLGQSVANLSPGLRIPLDKNPLNAMLYGAGSYVAVNEQSGSTSGPANGQSSGGLYQADLTVTMVRVYVTGGAIGRILTLGGDPVDITVARATAHSEHKQTRVCSSSPTKTVSGDALIASVQVDPILQGVTVGDVQIPATGGSARKGVNGVVFPQNDGRIVRTTDAAAATTGTIGATENEASSYAQVAGLCLLRLVNDPNCLITATALRAQSNSEASASAQSSNANGTEFVDLVVAGIAINPRVPPNTVIRLPLNLGFVILNEQVADGAADGHTGLTVRALHLIITLPTAPLLPGADIVVAEAHSDATWRA